MEYNYWYSKALSKGKVLDEVGTPYMYWYSNKDKIVWLLHQADKRIFKSTFYDSKTFILPNSEYDILEISDIKID